MKMRSDSRVPIGMVGRKGWAEKTVEHWEKRQVHDIAET